jgi:arylsulfatase A-like enzyme
MPTFASIAGAELPRGKTIDGIDISSALRAEGMPSRDALYYYCIDSLNAVRVGNWKLHVGAGPDGNAKEMPQLFDIHGDPRESYNIANRYPDTVEELRSRLEAFDAEVKAECGQG